MYEHIPSVTIFGVPISKLNFRDTVSVLIDMIEKKKPGQIITANPIMVTTAMERPNYMEMMKRAELIVPDGAGVVWASGYVGNPVAEKVAGIELMDALLGIAEKKGWRPYFLGASPDVIETAVRNIQAKYPKLQFAGYRDGFFGPEQDAEVVAQIRAAAPDMLFVGRSVDTQEPWIDRYKHELAVPVMMGVGGSFDIAAGKLKRAPQLFINLRLEWFYRLLQEPTRYKRMLVLPKFMLKVIREKENVQKGWPHS